MIGIILAKGMISVNENIIQQILDERAQNPNTRKAYKATYNKMAKFEKRTGKQFDTRNEQLVFDYITDPASKYDDVSSVNTALPQIKYYLRATGWNKSVEDLAARDFDISYSMRSALVESLDEIYQRGFLLYQPSNGDAFFPLVSMAWMGMPIQETLQLSDNSVDLSSGLITSESLLIFPQMPPNMIQILEQYSKSNQSDKGNGQTKLPDRIGRFIYKTSFPGSSSAGKGLDGTTYAYFFRQVNDKFNDTHDLQIRTTYGDIVQSAKYYKARQMELDGTDWQEQSNGKMLQEIFVTQRIEPGYLRYNYQMYKKAFGLK